MILLRLLKGDPPHLLAAINVQAYPAIGDCLDVPNGERTLRVEVLDKAVASINAGTLFAADESWAFCRIMQ